MPNVLNTAFFLIIKEHPRAHVYTCLLCRLTVVQLDFSLYSMPRNERDSRSLAQHYDDVVQEEAGPAQNKQLVSGTDVPLHVVTLLETFWKMHPLPEVRDGAYEPPAELCPPAPSILRSHDERLRHGFYDHGLQVFLKGVYPDKLEWNKLGAGMYLCVTTPEYVEEEEHLTPQDVADVPDNVDDHEVNEMVKQAEEKIASGDAQARACEFQFDGKCSVQWGRHDGSETMEKPACVARQELLWRNRKDIHRGYRSPLTLFMFIPESIIKHIELSRVLAFFLTKMRHRDIKNLPLLRRLAYFLNMFFSPDFGGVERPVELFEMYYRMLCAHVYGRWRTNRKGEWFASDYSPVLMFFLFALFGKELSGNVLTYELVYYLAPKARGQHQLSVTHQNQLYATQARKEGGKGEQAKILPKMPPQFFRYFRAFFLEGLYQLPVTSQEILANCDLVMELGSEVGFPGNPMVFDGWGDKGPIAALRIKPGVSNAFKKKVVASGQALYRYYEALKDYWWFHNVNYQSSVSQLGSLNNLVMNWLRLESHATTRDFFTHTIEPRGTLFTPYHTGRVYKYLAWLFQSFRTDENAREGAWWNMFTTVVDELKMQHRSDASKRVANDDGILQVDMLLYLDFVDKGSRFVHAFLNGIDAQSLVGAPWDVKVAKIEEWIEDESHGWVLNGFPEDVVGTMQFTVPVVISRCLLYFQACIGCRENELLGKQSLFLPIECKSHHFVTKRSEQFSNNYLERFGVGDLFLLGTSKTANDAGSRKLPEYIELYEQVQTQLGGWAWMTNSEREDAVGRLNGFLNAFVDAEDSMDHNTKDALMNSILKPTLYGLDLGHLFFVLYELVRFAQQSDQIQNKFHTANLAELKRRPSVEDRYGLGGVVMSHSMLNGDEIHGNVYATTHDLRGLYATESFKLFAPPGTIEILWIQSVMGHDMNNVQSSVRYSRKRTAHSAFEANRDVAIENRMVKRIRQVLSARLHHDRLVYDFMIEDAS